MRFLFAATVACLLFLVSAARGAEKELVIGISQFPSNFNPLINSMLAKSYMLALARRPITVYDQDWNLICLLCTDLPNLEKGTAVKETTADGKPGIAVTYELDPQAVWGDGTPITTRDVLFTWEVGKHELSGVGDAESFRRITEIDVHSDKKFTLHVNKRTCDYAGINGFELLPAHLDRPNFAEPREYRNRSAYERDTTNPGLWFGPYRVSEVVSGSHVVFERNPRWWGKQPYFNRIVIRAIDNTSAMTASLLSGGLDYIAGELGLSIDQAMAFEKRAAGQFDFTYKPGLIYEHIDVNLDQPALQDRRVRRALLHAVDREAISKILFGGHQPVAHGQTNPLDRVYNPDIPKYAFDPDTAEKLLESAGWTREGARDIRRNAEGAPLRFPTGAAKPMAQTRNRRPYPQRTAPRLFRRNRDATEIPWPRDVCLAVGTAQYSPLDAAFGDDPERGQRLVRPELSGLQQSRTRQGARRGRDSLRAKGQPGALGPFADDLFKRPARPAALFPGDTLYPAEMAKRPAADRPPVYDHPLGRGVVRRRASGLMRHAH
ncbi:MAG: peptide ABC transporter substrate-binding protein [Rickettsiales bacterium]